MVIVHFNDTLSIDGVAMEPGTRYILPMDVFQRCITYGQKIGVQYQRYSGWNNYEKRFNPHAAKRGDPVLVWRHNAFGDNLMITGLVAYLRRELKMRVMVVCGPAAIDTWRMVDEEIRPKWLLPSPVKFEMTQTYFKHHLIYHAMLEEDREHDQNCGIDGLWRFAGFDDDVAINYRRPILRLNPPPVPHGEEVFLHVHANNSTRTPPLSLFMDLARMIGERGVRVRFCGVDKEIANRINQIGVPKNCLNMVGKGTWGAMIRDMESRCRLLIGPDSALVHLAEGLGIPQIGLWGLFHPNDRVKHYRYHTAIQGGGCEHSPCRWHGMDEFPVEKCGRFLLEGHCNALVNITAEQVMEKVKL